VKTRITKLLFSLAAAVPPPVKVVIPEANKEQAVLTLFTQIINFMLVLGAGLAVIAFIVGGIQYILGASGYVGERGTDRASIGRKTMTYAVIGIFFLVFAYVIARYVSNSAVT
jgi:type IV secretory pathway VirB2 component (pilin)